jgi:hypothetical protein
MAVALPSVPAILSATEAEAPEASAEVDALGAGAGELTGPLVAHVKDLSTGEMAVYMGNSEVTVRDPRLAARILSAAR